MGNLTKEEINKNGRYTERSNQTPDLEMLQSSILEIEYIVLLHQPGVYIQESRAADD